MIELDKIYNGDALSVLKKFPNNSVDCVVTSPPYWGLRDYGKGTNIIWDGDPDCKHEWVEYVRKGIKGGSNSDKVSVKGMDNFQIVPDNDQLFCEKCGAWYGQLGLEPTFEMFVDHLLQIFDEVHRVLKDSGTVFVNLGDSYSGAGGMGSWVDNKAKKGMSIINNYNRKQVNGVKSKSLIMVPERFAIGMIERGWILRNQIIWHKPNVMPESVKDRFTVDFEKVFFFVKSRKYYFEQQFEKADYDGRKDTFMKGSPKYKNGVVPNSREHTLAVRGHERWKEINGVKVRNKRTVWRIPTKPFKGSHFAVFPPALVEACLKAGCPKGGVVLDPFIGSGTVGVVAKKLSMYYVGIELNKDYVELAEKRIRDETAQMDLFEKIL